jgi:hypothetical protein
MQKMKENREQYEQLANRAAKLLAAIANVIMKGSPEKLKGMEGNVARLLMCVLHPFIPTRQLDTQSNSTLREIRSTIEARLHSPAAPTGNRAAAKRFFRAKAKDAARMSADQEEINKLGVQLDRAIEDFGVRTFINQNLLRVRAHEVHQVTSSIRVELVLEDVRALSVRLSKHIEEINREGEKRLEEIQDEISRSAMNGM